MHITVKSIDGKRYAVIETSIEELKSRSVKDIANTIVKLKNATTENTGNAAEH